MSKVCGIYKITSPSGKIYIGQSIDVKGRFKAYRSGAAKQQTHLGRSFEKHGYHNHKFEIIHPCKREELNDLEIYYIELFQTFATTHGLNSKAGGQSGGCCSEEVKQKLRKPKSDAARENCRLGALNRPPVSEATREKHRKRMMGNKYLLGKKVWEGRHHSEETKKVIREKRKLQVMPTGFTRPWSDQQKQNQSNVRRGANNPNYKHGKKMKS